LWDGDSKAELLEVGEDGVSPAGDGVGGPRVMVGAGDQGSGEPARRRRAQMTALWYGSLWDSLRA
jgi:hypothetical protein